MNSEILKLLAAAMLLAAAASTVVVAAAWIFLSAVEWAISLMETFPPWSALDPALTTSKRSSYPKALARLADDWRMDPGTVGASTGAALIRFSAPNRPR
jgi:hypothetical protein